MLSWVRLPWLFTRLPWLFTHYCFPYCLLKMTIMTIERMSPNLNFVKMMNMKSKKMNFIMIKSTFYDDIDFFGGYYFLILILNGFFSSLKAQRLIDIPEVFYHSFPLQLLMRRNSLKITGLVKMYNEWVRPFILNTNNSAKLFKPAFEIIFGNILTVPLT